jgi:formamidopyrimidine-DNA glycosylase
MPELPEVETVVRGLRPTLIGRTVQSVWYDWEKVIKTPSPSDFTARIVGQTFRATRRRAKYILCDLDYDVLLVHLRMTGRLYVSPNDVRSEDRWVHLRLGLDNGHTLCFSDARRFGRAYLTHDPATVLPQLGPEPLEEAFTPAVLQTQLGKRARAIKPTLLDQSIVAGVGNIYADESLYLAQIHPLRKVSELNDAQITVLHGTIRQVLQAGIDHEGSTIGWYRKPDGERGEAQEYFHVYGRDGQACRVCGTMISKIWVGQRGTHFCPTCQPVP